MAQAPPIAWQAHHVDTTFESGWGVDVAAPDGYFICGTRAIGTEELFVARLDAVGDTVWTALFGGSSGETGLDVKATADGGCIVLGRTYSDDGDVIGHIGGYDFWVLKLDASGNLQWQKCLGGSITEAPRTIALTPDGGYAVAGYTASSDFDVSINHGSEDVWLVKLDSAGNILWEHTYGDVGIDRGYGMITTLDGGFAIAGSNSVGEFWVLKTDSLGTLEWEQVVDGTYQYEAQDVIQTMDGGYLAGGHAQSPGGDGICDFGGYSGLVVKMDSTGAIQWTQCFSGPAHDVIRKVLQTDDGNYVCIARTLSDSGNITCNHSVDTADIWIARLDAGGNILWDRCLGGSGIDDVRDALIDTDGGLVVVAASTSSDGDALGYHGGGDAWVVKFEDLTPVSIAEKPRDVSNPFSLAPDPANDHTVLYGDLTIVRSIEIRDALGRVLRSQPTSGALQQIDLDLHGLPAGPLFVQITSPRRTVVLRLTKV